MSDEQSIIQIIWDFLQAFPEFLGRPKTIFDMKDRFRLVLMFIIVISVLESIIYFLKM